MAYAYFSLLCIVAICIRMTLSVPIDTFFPFGVNNSDTQLPSGDYGFASLNLTHDFVFFNRTYQKVNVDIDGYLLFDDVDLDAYANIFWADVDTRGIGEIYYRVTTDSSVVHKANDIVNNVFQLESDFNADEVIVATWDHVGYYNRKTNKVNTFQCVVATDGTRTFAMYLFLDNGINWAINIDGDAVAVVGFSSNNGDEFQIEGSFTEDIINIEEKSNVDNACHKGLFVFQVNDNAIRSPGDATCPAVGTTSCKDRIVQIACQILNSTVAELPLPCQSRPCIRIL